MTWAGEAAGGDVPARATVAIALPERERGPIAHAFAAAGYPVAVLEAVADLPAFATRGVAFAAVILDAAADAASVVETVRRLREGGVRLPVIYITTDIGLDAISAAGVDDDDEIVLRPIDIDALRWRVEAMAIRAQVEPTGDEPSDTSSDGVLRSGRVDAAWVPEAPVFAVFTPKGGVGKTTIATNLAVALQVRKHRRVLLVDADTVTGHVPMSLGIESVTTLADSWDGAAEGQPGESILKLASVHESGLKVASVSNNPLTAPTLEPERIADAVLEARGDIDAIVVDLHPSYNDINLAVFTIADRIVLPVTPDLPAIRAAVQFTQIAHELGVRERLAMVVNRAKSGVSVADVERATGLRAFAEIRSAGLLLVWAANSGKTLIDKYPRERVTADFDALAERLLLVTGGQAVPTRSTSRLAGIFRKASAQS